MKHGACSARGRMLITLRKIEILARTRMAQRIVRTTMGMRRNNFPEIMSYSFVKY